MESAFIEAECVEIHCFWGKKEMLFETLEMLSQRQEATEKVQKVVIYIEGIVPQELELIC